MKPKKKEFDKAVKNKINGNFGGAIACILLTFMFMYSGYVLCIIEPISQDVAAIFFMLGIFTLVGLIWNLVEALTIALYSPKGIIEDYHLCKRCKCLIKKDKVFCNDCKHSLRRSLKHIEDKQYISEYKKIVKKEKKK